MNIWWIVSQRSSVLLSFNSITTCGGGLDSLADLRKTKITRSIAQYVSYRSAHAVHAGAQDAFIYRWRMMNSAARREVTPSRPQKWEKTVGIHHIPSRYSSKDPQSDGVRERVRHTHTVPEQLSPPCGPLSLSHIMVLNIDAKLITRDVTSS